MKYRIVIAALLACNICTGQMKLTVVERHNQHPGSAYGTDTLVNLQAVNLRKTKVDVYFCHYSFHIPYYMPTASIYKDSNKLQECNWGKYPSTVKCYKYDNKNRVVSMQVEGSGTTGVYTFRYNDSDQIIDITGNSGDKYKMTYDQEGNLLLLTVDGGTVQRQLEFKYGG
jgi:YD repeat-containing protein